jgi:predicted metal-dependent peptidase
MSIDDKLRSNAEVKLAKGRAIVGKKAPYIVKTVYAFVPLMVPDLRTMGVSKGLVLIVDPVWLLGLEDKHVAAALFHEAMHVVREHLPRIEKLPDKDMANAAADLVINPEMRAAGWELPHGIFPEDYGFPEGLILEEYYKLLDQRRKQQQQQQQQPSGGGGGKGKPQQKQQDGQGSGGQGGGVGKQPGQSQQPQGTGGKNPQQGQGQGQSQSQGQDGSGGHPHLPNGTSPGIAAGCCGGIAGRQVSPLEQKFNEENGRSELEQKRIVKQTLEDIKQHAAQYGRGSVPGSLLQAIDVAEKKSTIRWQSKLMHWLKKCFGALESGGMDYSLAQPAKSSYALGFPRPGLVQYQPEVAFILDTSASMGTEQIIEALSESIGIMMALSIDAVWFVQADTRVTTQPKRVRLRELKGRVKIHGRGGTNFDHALRTVEKLRPKPDLCIYFTDGDGHVSYKPKGMEVVWCVVRNHWNQKPPCDWGHTVIIAQETPSPEGVTTQRGW